MRAICAGEQSARFVHSRLSRHTKQSCAMRGPSKMACHTTKSIGLLSTINQIREGAKHSQSQAQHFKPCRQGKYLDSGHGEVRKPCRRGAKQSHLRGSAKHAHAHGLSSCRHLGMRMLSIGCNGKINLLASACTYLTSSWGACHIDI